MPRMRKSLQDHLLQNTQPQWSDQKVYENLFPAGRLKMPKDLSTEEVIAWRQLFGPLQKRKTLTRADSPAAIVLLKMWMRWCAVEKLATANPVMEVTWTDKNGVEHFKTVEHPACKMATQLEARILAALKEFSATPASRDKTKPTKAAPPKEDAAAEVEKQKAVDALLSREAQTQQEAEREAAQSSTLADISLEGIEL